jgi:hypothetical protein
MGNYHATGDRLETLEKEAIAGRSLETDRKRFTDLPHFLEDFRPRPFDRSTKEFISPVIENADRGLPPVGIQANITHGKPPFALRELLSINPRRLTERGLAT